jgi:two-component system OmpR family response regulator
MHVGIEWSGGNELVTDDFSLADGRGWAHGGKPRVLIIEDDSQTAEMLRDTLGEHSILADLAADGVAMNIKMQNDKFDLVVLDVMLPGEDGLSLCRRLRASSNIPILIVTAVNGDVDRIVGLEIGADDYVTKPYNVRELIARIKALLRRSSFAQSSEPRRRPRLFRFDGWRLDPIRRQVHDPSNARVAMTTHEFDLLLALCQNPGHVMTREELLAVTHAGLAGPIERSVDVHISRLRQKVEADPRNPILVRTVRLGGYMFAAAVEEVYE